MCPLLNSYFVSQRIICNYNFLSLKYDILYRVQNGSSERYPKDLLQSDVELLGKNSRRSLSIRSHCKEIAKNNPKHVFCKRFNKTLRKWNRSTVPWSKIKLFGQQKYFTQILHDILMILLLHVTSCCIITFHTSYWKRLYDSRLYCRLNVFVNSMVAYFCHPSNFWST